MKRLLTVLLTALLVAATGAPALAWEFELKGLYENRLRYFGRLGNDDLFGKTNFQDAGAGTFIGFAGPNIYGTGNRSPVIADNGGALASPAQSPAVVITRGGFSRWGSDASYNDSRFSLEPAIRVNQAIRLHGVYNIGGIRNKYRQTGTNELGSGIGVAPIERYYVSQSSMNATDGVFETWEQFRATIQTPWCVFTAGLKNFPFGVGATLGENTRAETYYLIFPYDPFRVRLAFFVARGRFFESWYTMPDGDTKPEFFEALLLTYDQGPLSAGGELIYRTDHRGRGAAPIVANYGTSTASFNAAAGTQQARDDYFFAGQAFVKYFDGRFFANAEYFWVNVDRYFPVAVDGQFRPTHNEAYHWFSELGVVSGPVKVSLLYALSSGQVLNNGNPGKVYLRLPINYQAMEPYEFLIFNTYAGGNNGGWTTSDATFVSDEHGMMSDAYAFAARADYAVASNLNIWASYIWAHRLERAGTVNGQYRDVGNGSLGGVAVVTAAGAPIFPSPLLLPYGGVTPYVPDGFIGWEADAGVNWKLLEGFTLNLRYAYWQPGDWFTFAYQALVGPTAPGPGGTGILQGRSPINAFEGKLVVQF